MPLDYMVDSLSYRNCSPRCMLVDYIVTGVGEIAVGCRELGSERSRKPGIGVGSRTMLNHKMKSELVKAVVHFPLRPDSAVMPNCSHSHKSCILQRVLAVRMRWDFDYGDHRRRQHHRQHHSLAFFGEDALDRGQEAGIRRTESDTTAVGWSAGRSKPDHSGNAP